MSSANKQTYRYRSARTGHFVSEKYAKRYPKTTVREKVTKPEKPEKKKLPKRRPARISGKPSWAGGHNADVSQVTPSPNGSYNPPWHKRKSYYEN